MNREDFWDVRPGLLGILDCLRIAATMLGYPLAGFGWCVFLFALIESLTEVQGYRGGADTFAYCAYAIVPGWLLLRFGAGLFPFGRGLFGR